MRQRDMQGLRLRHRRGQSTVEYVLVISVIAIGMYAAAQYFVDGFRSGFQVMQQNTSEITQNGVVEGK